MKKISKTIDKLNKIKKFNEILAVEMECFQKIKKPEDIAKFKGIPSLKAGVYKHFTKMLKDRFFFASTWEDAAFYEKWLSLSEMESVWSKKKLRTNYETRLKYWDDTILGTYKMEDITLFSSFQYGSNECYLLWSKKGEPKVVQCNNTEELIFKNFNDFLDYILKALKEYQKEVQGKKGN